MKRALISKILMLLGFSTVATSCDPDNNDDWGDQVAMYGCPMATYIANVEVKDGATDTPIEGIRVSSVFRFTGEYWDEKRGEVVYGEKVDTIATALTNADGKAQLEWVRDIFENGSLVADDIDGEANGGEYNSASTTITTDRDDYVGGSGWDLGTATHNVTFSLTKK